MDIATEAGAYRILTKYAVVPPEKIIDWADREVMKSASPPDWLLNLSFAPPSFREIYEFLMQGPPETDQMSVLVLVFEALASEMESGGLSKERVAEILEQLAIEEYGPRTLFGCMYYFEDAYRAAREGYGDRTEVAEELRSFLRGGYARQLA